MTHSYTIHTNQGTETVLSLLSTEEFMNMVNKFEAGNLVVDGKMSFSYFQMNMANTQELEMIEFLTSGARSISFC